MYSLWRKSKNLCLQSTDVLLTSLNLCHLGLYHRKSILCFSTINFKKIQYSSFVTYVSRQVATRHNIIMTRHGWNKNLGEPMARPVVTNCSDLSWRPVWPDNSRQFIHNLAEMCEYSSGHVGTAGHGPTSIHNLLTYIQDLSGRCSTHAMSRQQHHVVPMSCHSKSGHSNGRNKVCHAVLRLVATHHE